MKQMGGVAELVAGDLGQHRTENVVGEVPEESPLGLSAGFGREVTSSNLTALKKIL